MVTADGQIRRVNSHQDPDLFFALRGGGAYGFAVLSSITLLEPPDPHTAGAGDRWDTGQR